MPISRNKDVPDRRAIFDRLPAVVDGHHTHHSEQVWTSQTKNSVMDEEKAECSVCGKACAIDELQWTGPVGDYICSECLGGFDYQNVAATAKHN